jgi:hypothetical protein
MVLCVVLFNRATSIGFNKLSDRISHLEEALKHSQDGGDEDDPLARGPSAGGGDRALPGEEDEEDEQQSQRRGRGRGSGSSSNNSSNHRTAPGRIEGRDKDKRKSAGGSVGSGRGGSSNSTSGNNKGSSSNQRNSTSPAARRPLSASDNSGDTGGSKYGNIGAIAQAKAAAARAKKKQLVHAPYATFESTGPTDFGASNSNAAGGGKSFEPQAQLLFRGADGRVAASQVGQVGGSAAGPVGAPALASYMGEPPRGDMAGNYPPQLPQQQYQQQQSFSVSFLFCVFAQICQCCSPVLFFFPCYYRETTVIPTPPADMAIAVAVEVGMEAGPPLRLTMRSCTRTPSRTKQASIL